MAGLDSRVPRSENPAYRGNKPGWTSLHSWIFLCIVALGLMVLVFQNRYHYLAPPGAGKAYRIDKIFGSMQEFDPSMGWISAQLQATYPAQATTRMEPPPMLPPPQVAPPLPERQQEVLPPVSKESTARPEETLPPEKTSSPITELPIAKESTEQPVVEKTPPPPPPMGREERLKLFKSEFPDYGEEEFELANDDLFPDWQKTFAPDATWKEFLPVYREFIQWWIDSGSPPEPGAKLWQDFMNTKKDQ